MYQNMIFLCHFYFSILRLLTPNTIEPIANTLTRVLSDTVPRVLGLSRPSCHRKFRREKYRILLKYIILAVTIMGMFKRKYICNAYINVHVKCSFTSTLYIVYVCQDIFQSHTKYRSISLQNSVTLFFLC